MRPTNCSGLPAGPAQDERPRTCADGLVDIVPAPHGLVCDPAMGVLLQILGTVRRSMSPDLLRTEESHLKRHGPSDSIYVKTPGLSDRP